MIGLVLTAGGARGAYQAGVLKRIGEIPQLKARPSPFPIVTGASAGAINGSAIASHSHQFELGCQQISNLWGEICFEDVFRSDPLSLLKRSAVWLFDLSLGGLIGGGRAQSLLDFSPLRSYLRQHLRLERISQSIELGHLYALGISATDYYSGKSFTFIQGKPGHPIWEKTRRLSLSVPLSADHIWASCAIPVVFQPVSLQTPLGQFYFGDGALRLVSPLSPAIRLGAKKLFSIAIRCQKSSEHRLKSSLLEGSHTSPTMKAPPLAQIFGTTLNTIFLDHLDSDLEHLKRMNQMILSISSGSNPFFELEEPMQVIETLVIHPSLDLAERAESCSHRLPFLASYLLEGLGASQNHSADLMSYILFHPEFTRSLIQIGYEDAHARISEIEHFLLT
jgi:NTE family protein